MTDKGPKIRRRDFLRSSLAAGVGGATIGATEVAARGLPGQDNEPAGRIFPVGLRCESFRNPLGIDTVAPRLSWRLQPTNPDDRGLRQLAYQIYVASSPEVLERRGDLWESGFVETANQLHVEYAGAPLQSGQRCFWRVRVWDTAGERSRWSLPAWWEMGLLGESDWHGYWIGDGSAEPATRAAHYDEDPAPLLRHEFEIDKPVARARLYASGLGYYEMRLNGDKVSDHCLDPAWTSFGERVPYTSHDVTSMLNEGTNVMGAMLGNGWYNPLPLQMWGRINIREHLLTGRPRLIAQLNITYQDGTTASFGTDEGWQHHPGPIVRNSVYLGEEYDARLELSGWDAPGFDASGWNSAVPVEDPEDAPLGKLEAQSVPPIRVTDRLRPRRVNEISPGVFIFDMGQNFAGWVRLHVEGPRGTRIKMRTGELLYPDGRLNPMTAVAGQIKRPNADGSSRGGPGAPMVAEQLDVYTLSGNGTETYTPRFTFHGFRYVEVTGFPGEPTLEAIEGLRLNTDVENSGDFTCSDDSLNQIQRMVQWTLLSNLFSVQSDCPAREKFQYGGDIVATSEMATLNYDFASVYAKTVRDHADAVQGDAERGEGWITETAPFVGISADNYVKDAGPIGWGLAHPVLTEQLYRYYGDRRIVAEQYPVAKRWVDLYADHAPNHIVGRCLSDHESLDPKPVALTATAHYYQAARLVARMAEILGNDDDHHRYDELASQIGEAFVDRFLRPGTGIFDIGTQACQATALAMDLVPGTERTDAIARMVQQVVEEHSGHVATGIFGTKYLLDELTRTGHADVALAMVQKREFPGWGHMIERGATTIWEHWEYSDNVYSHNHPMFGSVSEWFFKGLGGIRPHPEARGFDRFYIEPNPVGDLSWAQTTIRGVRGKIDCHWYIEGDNLHVNVEIPVNTLAQVKFPTTDAAAVAEGGVPAADAPGLRALATDPGSARYLAQSGRYRFVAPFSR